LAVAAITTITALTALLTGCRWASYGFDDANSRNNSSETVLEPGNVAAPRR
jgi:hypothetical protein